MGILPGTRLSPFRSVGNTADAVARLARSRAAAAEPGPLSDVGQQEGLDVGSALARTTGGIRPPPVRPPPGPAALCRGPCRMPTPLSRWRRTRKRPAVFAALCDGPGVSCRLGCRVTLHLSAGLARAPAAASCRRCWTCSTPALPGPEWQRRQRCRVPAGTDARRSPLADSLGTNARRNGSTL